MQDSLPAAGPALPGGIGYPQGSCERFHGCNDSPFPSFLARCQFVHLRRVGHGNPGRVDLGGYPPRPSTHPDVQNSSIRFLTPRLRCMAQQPLDHVRRWEARNDVPGVGSQPRSFRLRPRRDSQCFQILRTPLRKSREAARVTGDSVVRVVALQLLAEFLVLLLDRVMPVGPTPLP